jgi:hypothetical protein
MNRLEKLKQEKADIDEQINKRWFKHKLTRELPAWAGIALKGESEWGKNLFLKKECSEFSERYREILFEIEELEQQSREQRIADIWKED